MPRALTALALTLLAAPAAAADGVEFFENRVRPVLAEKCASCHSAKARKTRGGLALDGRAAILKGGDSGPAVVPGKPGESLLIRAVRHEGDLQMPPKGKLSDRAVADLTAWVRMGAPMPDDGAVAGVDLAKGRQFWSFRPVRRPAMPAVRDAGWARNPVDRFVLARLEAEGLHPAAEADRRTILRRLAFDLTGLPPGAELAGGFLNDRRPGAYERLVDRLLADPGHGEHWARHWLDVARYAEDQAHTFAVKPNTQAWRYRDWVIGALNADVGYDRFVRLQIAADRMPGATVAERAALGLFGLGAQYYHCANPAKAIADELDDRVDTLARGFLGLTVACARCHNHKFDPIPTEDYYALAGVFQSSRIADLPLVEGERLRLYEAAKKRMGELDRASRDLLAAERRRQAAADVDRLADYLEAVWRVRATGKPPAAVAKEAKLRTVSLARLAILLDPAKPNALQLGPLAAWRRPVAGHKAMPADLAAAARKLQERLTPIAKDPRRKGLTPAEAAALQLLVADRRGTFSLGDPQVIESMPAAVRGKFQATRAELERLRREEKSLPVAHGLAEGTPADMKVYLRGNPEAPGPVAPRRFLRVLAGDDPPRFRRGSGRLELADAIASPDNPLTARVIVNRLWLHHFGRGIVGTPSNFGLLGERPTHPELLDWLACELVDSGWSLKHVHRLIVTSAAYRQASVADAEAVRRDPDNRLLGRARRRRLEVESWRDALLSVTGELRRELGGPTFDLAEMARPRRTVYAKVSRHELNPLLRLFDFPDANITAERRNETTVPQQQLFVLNSPFMIDRARRLAARFAQEPDAESRVRRAYRLALGRDPDADELGLGVLYLAQADDPAEVGKNQLPRAVRFAQVLLAGNEFLYVD